MSKTKLLSLIIGVIISSCSQDDLFNCVDSEDVIMLSNEKAINRYIEQRHPVKSRSNTRLIPIIQHGDTVAFLANYDEGWELFSNNTSLPMVLMKSESGSFYPLDKDKKSPFESFYDNFIEDLSSRPVCEETSAMWDFFGNDMEAQIQSSSGDWVGNACDFAESVYNPKGGRLKTQWGADEYYNQCIPYYYDFTHVHSSVGCNAVALGQMLYHSNKYFGLPKSTVTTAVYDPETNQYNFSGDDTSVWSLMDSGEDESFKYNKEKMMPTAVFLGYIAKIINSNFGRFFPAETSAEADNCSTVIANQMNVGAQRSFYSWDNIVSTLSMGYPSLSVSFKTNNGHTYIIDEAKQIREIWYDVFSFNSPIGGEDIDDGESSENSGLSLDDFRKKYGNISYDVAYVFHERWLKMNWGWEGQYNEVSINADKVLWEFGPHSYNRHYNFIIY